jgi:D-beta-D-heptose 7-phosphate kinase / D-beta-D-heptose 1-phosphate adenosyltransferase
MERIQMKIIIPKFENITVLVVGDVMLDKYWQGPAHRISPEAPVPIVHVHMSEERPGGAGNVALNLKSLGSQVILLGLIGNDQAGHSLHDSLENAGIVCHLHRAPNQPTIAKLRVLGPRQQLIRLDFEDSFSTVDKEVLINNFKFLLTKADAIIFSDYGKGTLSCIREMIELAQAKSKLIFVDPKSKDFSIYRHATIITPNLKEFQQVVGACHSEGELIDKAKMVIRQNNISALLITRGEDGMTLVCSDKEPISLRAHASEVYDVSGAGDTVISVLAASIAAGSNHQSAILLANMAAGIVVRKLGVATVSVPELRRALQRYLGGDLGILHEEELLIAVEDARAHGERIVMTNGCFDILHPGHIAYLQEAKSLGDRLIVAVNEDASVKKLKGSYRPINKLQDRMSMLTALRCVDWVVSFAEETPERLITRILPDILVKGGDYQVSEIAGSKQVIGNGGAVKILSFLPGHSTSNLINKMREEIVC